MRCFFSILMACNEGGIVLYVTLLLVVSGSCGRLVKLKSLEDSRSNSTDDKGRVTDLHLHRGRLVIGQNSSSWKRSPAASAGYQADMGTRPSHFCTPLIGSLCVLISSVLQKAGCGPLKRLLAFQSKGRVTPPWNRS